MIGSTIGGYTIVSELGSGGMGSVYLGEREGEKVAIKVVHPHLIATPGFFKRFLREADLGRQVQHENVVRTVDVDATMVDDRQINYMVMEYVEGRSLRDLLHDLKTVPETLLREIALQMAAGVAAIHAEGIVHRDLKPENVLITDDHRVRIMDLGVAKLQEASVALTKEGQFAGSFLYAAPEQFSGATVGPASDLYSLGVMLYELATGSNPFRRDDAAAVIQGHLQFEPPRANDRNHDVSSFFSEVLVHLMAKKASERLESAGFLKRLMEEAEESEWWAEREQALRKTESRFPKIRVRRETELHGREEELQQLRDAWQRAKDGEGNTVLVEGEAGVGKTRLMDAFLREVSAEDLHLLYGSYPPSGGMGGLSDAVMGKFGTTGLEKALAPYLNETPSLIPAFVALIRREAAPTGSEPLHGDALHAVCCNMMQALAAEKPTIWVIDELHFAPAESRKLVLSLARAVEEHRILLLVTSRPGLPEDEEEHFTRLDNLRRVQLHRLSPREVIELVRDALKSESLADRLGAQIAYKSDGIPFFVFEIIRGLKEARYLDQSADGTYVESKPISEIEVPSAVKDLIEGRLRDLSQEERAILDVGAVQGFEFDPDLVARVRESKRVQVLETLAAIERRSGIVRASGRRYAFDHPQIQEVLSANLSEILREEYHGMLAEAFARRERIDGPDDVEGEEAFFLAWHGLHGSEPEAGVPYLGPALKHLEEAWQWDRTVQLAGRALDARRLLRGEDRIKVLRRRSAALRKLGQPDGERHDLEEILALAEQLEDPGLRASAHRGMASYLWVTAQYADALAHGDAAMALAAERGDRDGEMKGLNARGLVYWNLGRFEDAKRCFADVLAMARELEDSTFEIWSTGNLGLVSSGTGDVEAAHAYMRKAIELSDEHGVRRSQALQRQNLADNLGQEGRYGEALSLTARALEIYREIGQRFKWDCNRIRGKAFAALGMFEEARESLARALDDARTIADRRGEGYVLHDRAEALELQGDGAEAEAAYGAALALRREIRYPTGIAETLVALGRIHAAAGDAERAAAELDEARTVAAEVGARQPLALAEVYASLLPGREPVAAIPDEDALGAPDKLRLRYALWKATGDPAQLAEARRHLAFMRDHAPDEYRDTMVENVPLHRAVREARA